MAVQTKLPSGAPMKAAAPSKVVPPGPKGLALVGNLLAVRRDVLGFFSDCARRPGDVVRMRFGPWPTLLLSNPANLESVLVKNASNFVKQRLFWRQVTAIFGSGLLTSEGAFWLHQRRLAAPAFAGPQLVSYGAVMVHTLQIAAKTLFGTELKQNLAEIDEAVGLLTDEIATRGVGQPNRHRGG